MVACKFPGVLIPFSGSEWFGFTSRHWWFLLGQLNSPCQIHTKKRTIICSGGTTKKKLTRNTALPKNDLEVWNVCTTSVSTYGTRNTGRCCVVCFSQNATKSKASRTQSTSVKDTHFLKLASPNLKSCCTKSEATDRIFFFGKFRLTSIAAFWFVQKQGQSIWVPYCSPPCDQLQISSTTKCQASLTWSFHVVEKPRTIPIIYLSIIKGMTPVTLLDIAFPLLALIFPLEFFTQTTAVLNTARSSPE